jgi:hypothetical protein
LPASENIVSIDYRPATGQLYAVGPSSRIYFINKKTGVVTSLASASLTSAIVGGNASLNFNSTVERICLVTDSGQNLRLYPELGIIVATDGSINGGANPKIGVVAYTNSMAGASTTMLYHIDFEKDKLYLQNPPKDGGMQVVGDLGVNFEGVRDVDVLAHNSLAFAVTYSNRISNFYTIDLATGKAVNVGVFKAPVIRGCLCK